MLNSSKLARSHPLSQKLHKMLGHSLDSPDTAAALEALDVFCSEEGSVDVDSGNALKAELDARAMRGHRAFLASFAGILGHVDAIEAQLDAVNATYAEMHQQLAAAKDDSALLLVQTKELKLLREKAIAKKTIANTFLDRFTPSDAEVQVLTSSNTALTDDFFTALNRLAKISDDCNAFLMNENQKAGNEIIESIAIYQEKAYNKLYNWVQLQLPNMRQETPELSPLLKKAMAALKSRPSLFQSCMQEISQIRQTTVVQHFLDALTRGGPQGLPRPIELHAHDPIRYVGDMLAWLHQSTVCERELVESLFFADAESTSGVRVSSNDDVFSTLKLGVFLDEEEVSMYTLLDKCTERTVRPLKSRIDEVLASHPTATVSYKIANMLQFYAHTIGRVVGVDAVLVVELKGMHRKAFGVFLGVLEAQAGRYAVGVQKPGRELVPPGQVKEAVLQLRELMASYESSMLIEDDFSVVKTVAGENAATEPQSEAGFSQILAVSLDPLLAMCAQGAASLPKFENALYIANCLFFIQSAITLYEFTASRVESIQTQLDAQIDILISEQYSTILTQSGLSPLISAMDLHLHKTPLSLVPALDPRAISAAMQGLDVYLCTAGYDAQAALGRLISMQLRERALQGAVRRFLDTYERFVGAVGDPANLYEFPKSLVRGVGEVETLLVV
ncbi:Golgi transport complex subunit 6 [Podochytrium sp. JEL0797]|nr:Golgi transport complex subunit 6 [Podochytrium sp. JEL0797]